MSLDTPKIPFENLGRLCMWYIWWELCLMSVLINVSDLPFYSTLSVLWPGEKSEIYFFKSSGFFKSLFFNFFFLNYFSKHIEPVESKFVKQITHLTQTKTGQQKKYWSASSFHWDFENIRVHKETRWLKSRETHPNRKYRLYCEPSVGSSSFSKRHSPYICEGPAFVECLVYCQLPCLRPFG